MHFTPEEFTRSNTAERLGIKNEITEPRIRENLTRLCTQVLEPLRAHIKSSPFKGEIERVIISSGYRCPQLNQAVGGVPNSLHTQGRAADIVPPQQDNNGRPIPPEERSAILQEWYQYIRDHLPHTELILERTWIHVALSLCLILLLPSCRTVTPYVSQQIAHDTVYIHQQHYDSIYIDHWHTTEYHPSSLIANPSPLIAHQVDTIVVNNKEVQYKYRLLRDTVRVYTERSRSDSIPIIQKVYVPQKPSRYTQFFNTLCRLSFYLLLILLVLLIAKLVRK